MSSQTLRCFYVFASSLCFRIVLLLVFPALYGTDSVLHSRNHGLIFLSHQLPMLQLLIHTSYGISSHPMVLRVVMAILASLSGVGFYLLGSLIVSADVAFWAAMFFVTNPFLVEVSAVPYSEILMIGGLVLALYCYLKDQQIGAALGMAIACLSRYEAWILCPILVFDYWRSRGFATRALLRAIALFASMPILWIAWHFSLSTPGSFVIEFPHSPLRFVRWIYITWITIKETPLPVVALALLGMGVIWKRRSWTETPWLLAACFYGLFLLSILFSAHGDDHAGTRSTELFVSSREAALPLTGLLLLAAVGLGNIWTARWRRFAVGMIALSIGLGIVQTIMFLHLETSEPRVNLSYRTAQYLDHCAARQDRVLILAKPFTQADLKPYFDKVKQLQGQAGLAAARRSLKNFDLTPLDFQRTAVQSRLPATHLLDHVSLANPDVDWIAVWSDYPDRTTLGALKSFTKQAVLRSGSLSVTMWHRCTREFGSPLASRRCAGISPTT